MSGPTCLFFFEKWDGGTKLFTRHVKGCYIDLLSAQAYRGHMSTEEIKHILGSEDFALYWDSILCRKFQQDLEGKYFNQRLEAEMIKRQKYCASRGTNRKSYDGSYVPSYENHMDPHIEVGSPIYIIYINNIINNRGVVGGKEGNVVWIPPHLHEVWPHFDAMRRQMKKPMTVRAAWNILKKLSAYPVQVQASMVDQSITNGWQDVFPLKENRQVAASARRPSLPSYRERSDNVG